MTRAELIVCEHCSRHVRSDETACPFCGSARVARPARPFAGPAPRLSRAALALASMAALSACKTNVPEGTPAEADSGLRPPIDNGPVAAYGAPPIMDAMPPAPPTPPTPRTTDAGASAPKPTPNMHDTPAPAYGGPPPTRP